MAVATVPRILQLSEGPSPRVTWAMGISLVFHCLLLAMFAGLRLAPNVERPQSSIQVSLVNLPSQARTAVSPKPAPVPVEQKPLPPTPVKPAVQPKPIPAPALARPEPMPKAVPAPKLSAPAVPAPTVPPALKATATRVAPVTAAPPPRQSATPPRETDRPFTDVLKQIELPPEAPQLGDLPPPSPSMPSRKVESYKKDLTAQKLDTRIRDLRIPDVPASISPGKSATGTSQAPPARPIISADILEKFQKPVEEIQRLPEHRPIEPRETRVASAKPNPPFSLSTPDQASPAEVTPATAIQAAGAGTSRYWALVEQKIKNKWVAPPVDYGQHYFRVAIRFTMDRSGRVIDVVVERSSGNDYYDNAGRRAVLAADPLPPVPPEIKERQPNPLIYFSVGEPPG